MFFTVDHDDASDRRCCGSCDLWLVLRLLLLLLTLLVLDDSGSALGHHDEKRQLLDSLIDCPLVAEEGHEDLALEEHQVEKLVPELSQLHRCLLLELLEVILHAFKRVGDAREVFDEDLHIRASVLDFIRHVVRV